MSHHREHGSVPERSGCLLIHGGFGLGPDIVLVQFGMKLLSKMHRVWEIEEISMLVPV